MAKRTSRSKRKNQRERVGRAKVHGLPAKELEERRSRPPVQDTPKKRRRDEDEDERASDAGDSEPPPRSKKAPIPPFSQNTIFIGAAVINAQRPSRAKSVRPSHFSSPRRHRPRVARWHRQW
jgi:hypothetical protein